MWRTLWGAAWLSVASLAPATARGQSAETATSARSRVTIVADTGASKSLGDVARRVAAELEAQGFEVELREARATQKPSAPAAPGAVAFAIIELFEANGTPVAQITLAAAHDNSGQLSIGAEDLAADAARAGLAIRVVERLRALVLALSEKQRVALPADVAAFAGVPPTPTPPPAPTLTPPPAPTLTPPPTPTPTPSLPPTPPPTPVRAPTAHATAPADALQPWVGASLASLFSYRGLGAALGPKLEATLDLPFRLSIGVSASALFALAPVEGILGSAKLQHRLADVNLAYSFDLGSEVWSPWAGALLGVHSLEVVGQADPQQGQPRSGTSTGFAPGVALGLRVRPLQQLRLLAALSALVVVPEPLIVIVEEEAARAGFPLFSAALGAELTP